VDLRNASEAFPAKYAVGRSTCLLRSERNNNLSTLGATKQPDGQITSDFQKSRQAQESKIFRLSRRANHYYNSARLTRQEGRIAIVTNAGWDVVDAMASARNGVAGRVSRERSTGAQTNGAKAYGKSVWFRHPLLMSSCRWRMRSNRIGFTIKPAATVTR
jgi:hypothetical protein